MDEKDEIKLERMVWLQAWCAALEKSGDVLKSNVAADYCLDSYRRRFSPNKHEDLPPVPEFVVKELEKIK